VTNRNNEIPVKRRGGGIPWWAWLLGLAALALLAFMLLGNRGNNNAGGNTNQGGATPSPAGSAGTGGSPEASGGAGTSPEASGSPASSWYDTRTLTVVLPASAGLAA
jgi:hypothetical protein